jgi:hypothetical protein
MVVVVVVVGVGVVAVVVILGRHGWKPSLGVGNGRRVEALGITLLVPFVDLGRVGAWGWGQNPE